MSKPVVTVKDGKLRGVELKSVLGLPYVAFYDIPFAAPPIGELRFKVTDLLNTIKLFSKYIQSYYLTYQTLARKLCKLDKFVLSF